MGVSDEPERGYVEELQTFLAFLQTVWGLLAGVSVFFPLSNVLIDVVPLGAYGESGVYDQVAPALVSALATVVTLFVVLVSFSTRSEIGRQAKRGRTVRSASISLGSSLLCLIAYLALHQAYAEYAWQRWGWGSGDPRKLLVELPLATAYVGFFALLTRAFVLLGMMEFYSSGVPRSRSHSADS